jgi:hypothetical protein
MWNSTRTINPFLHLAAPPPPPPYVEPPAYATEDPATLSAESQQAQGTTLTAELTSPPPSVHPPATEDSATLSAESQTQGSNLTAELTSPPPSVHPPATEDPATLSAESQAQGTTLIPERTSPPPSFHPPASEAEVEAVVSAGPSASSSDSYSLDGGDDPDAGTSLRLSEKARGKKRMREEDYSSDEDENDENDDPFVEGGSRRGGSGHRRKKRDTRISTDRLDMSPDGWQVPILTFMDDLYTLSDRRRSTEKLKSIQRLYRGTP